jgi:hypothetical protein
MPEEPAQGRVEETSADSPGEGEWLSIAAAARRLGVSPRAIRSRVERGTIRWKPAGNTGKLVWVPSGEAAAGGPEEDELELLQAELAELREAATELRVALARAEERANAAKAVAAAEVAAAKSEVAARDQLAAELRGLMRALRQELAEARRPWWRRWWSRDVHGHGDAARLQEAVDALDAGQGVEFDPRREP